MTLSLEGLRLPLTPFALELDVTLSAHVTAVFGPSGAGKTSLLEAVAGLRHPERGRIVLSGRVLDDAAAGVRVPPRQRAVGYVTQDDSLFPHLSVAGNLRYGAGRGVARKAPLGEDRIVDTLGLASLLDRSPATLSGGERRRVALGRALLSATGDPASRRAPLRPRPPAQGEGPRAPPEGQGGFPPADPLRHARGGRSRRARRRGRRPRRRPPRRPRPPADSHVLRSGTPGSAG